MTLRLHVLATTTLAGLVATGCGGGGPAACTEIGAATGVTVTVPRAVARGVDLVDVEVCQGEECRWETGRLLTGGQGPAVVTVPFGDLGDLGEFASVFDAGPARVTTTLRQGERLLAAYESDVELIFSYPNGRACDGDTFLHAGVRLAG